MHIFVINLARATDRREKMQAQLDALRVPFVFWEATDGRSIDDKARARVDHEQRKYFSPYPLTDNEIACWLSHLRVMERVAKGREPMALIMEDDTIVSSDFPRVLAAIDNQTRDFDFIFFHRNPKKGQLFAPLESLVADNKIGRIGYTHTGCQAYVVSRTGAQKMLDQSARFVHALDSHIHRTWANGFDIYSLEHPVVFHADDGHSYIDETRGHDRPREREAYCDANHTFRRFQRFVVRLKDSVHKRMAWSRYVKQGS